MLNLLFNHFLRQAQNATQSNDDDDEPEQAVNPTYDGRLTKRQKYAWAGVAIGIVLLLLVYPLNFFAWLITSASHNPVAVALTWITGFSFLFIANSKQRSPVPIPAPWPAFIGLYVWATWPVAEYHTALPGMGAGVPSYYPLIFFALAGLYQVIMGRHQYWIWIGYFVLTLFDTNLLMGTPFLLVPLLIESFQEPPEGLDKPPKILRLIVVLFIVATIGEFLYEVIYSLNSYQWSNETYYIFIFAPFFAAAHLQLLITPGWWRWELIKLRAIGGLGVAWAAIAIFMAIKGINQVDLMPLILFFALISTWPTMYLLPVLLGPAGFSNELKEGLRGLYRAIMIKLGWAKNLAKKMDQEWSYRFNKPADNPIWNRTN